MCLHCKKYIQKNTGKREIAIINNNASLLLKQNIFNDNIK
jgi:hypothetical protein